MAVEIERSTYSTFTWLVQVFETVDGVQQGEDFGWFSEGDIELLSVRIRDYALQLHMPDWEPLSAGVSGLGMQFYVKHKDVLNFVYVGSVQLDLETVLQSMTDHLTVKKAMADLSGAVLLVTFLADPLRISVFTLQIPLPVSIGKLAFCNAQWPSLERLSVDSAESFFFCWQGQELFLEGKKEGHVAFATWGWPKSRAVVQGKDGAMRLRLFDPGFNLLLFNEAEGRKHIVLELFMRHSDNAERFENIGHFEILVTRELKTALLGARKPRQKGREDIMRGDHQISCFYELERDADEASKWRVSGCGMELKLE